MTVWLVVTTPAALLLLVLLLGFVGCDFGSATLGAPPLDYDQTVASITGVVAYWSLAEAAGTTVAADSQGVDAGHPSGANPGTYTTLPAAVAYNAALKSAAVPGALALGAQLLTSNGGGTSVDFQGGFVEVPFNSALNPAAFTIAVGVSPGWAPDPTHPAFRVVMETGQADGFTDGFVLRANTSDQWEIGVGNGSANGVFVTGPHVTSASAVNFLVATYDGTSLTLFVDGDQVGSAAISPPYVPSTTSDLRIGSGSAKKTGVNPPPALFPFEGRIGSVALFNRALTTADIDTLTTAFLTSA